MTSTPAYGFRISQRGAGPMSTAIRSGNIKSIRDFLTQQFPTMAFETLEEGPEEVDKPEEPTATVPTAPVAEVPKEETTATLFEDYMANLPAVTRPLVTTDYKGVRGGRLGAGNYSTASMIPGAQVSTPAPAPAPGGGGAAGGNTTNYYGQVGSNYDYSYNNYGTIGYGGEDTGAQASDTAAAPAAQAARGMTPAWAKTEAQIGKTTNKAAAGLVPSTAQRGVYVAPTAPEASRAAAGAAQRIEERQAAQPGATGVMAAAGSDHKMGAQAAAALLAAPGSDRKAAQSALRQEEKGKIELTNNARKALQQAASGGDKKKK